MAENCPDTADLELLEQWNILQSGFRRLTDQLLADVQAKAGLTPSEFQVLWFLLTSPEQTAPMNQLAATLNFTTAGTTKVADRLTDAELLQRQPSAADRRVVLASLTAKGQRVAMDAALALAGALRERVVSRVGLETFASTAGCVRELDPNPGQTCRP
ncbi:MarR family winged helix-turn-helix transcriptional regulator [Streptacidiphilus jiangxiensis]|uniref:DNA-binding transcriptional regulator, MarR family n=1 Tax=Streptacidiphilus jiangxiensis TaxID=235985 RepID=A0A1H7SSL5_STRJI|nr:MarR family winged helix-turn-helix transcriptional regulator [Streptacidiphilus jiangxiensis]SEL74914.1 DNA-binding transcriptional regulator, MarR family [Streptacidiphilus jiangxiensis]